MRFPRLDISFLKGREWFVYSLLGTVPNARGRRPVDQWAAQWWERLRIQHKVWAVLLLLCLPLIGGLATHLYMVEQILTIQEQRQDLVLASEQVELLGRLAVDIEDSFRGYVLTQQPAFLAPLTDADAKIGPALTNAGKTLGRLPGSPDGLGPIERQLNNFLRSKHELIADIQRGDAAKTLAHIRSGEGLRLSDHLRQDLRFIEDRLDQQRVLYNVEAESLSQRMFIGLWIALAGVVVLGWMSSRVLARSLTNPITRLQSATAKFGAHVDSAEIANLLTSARASKDELGQLANAYLDMARQIGAHVRALEVLNTIGQDINTIGPDGLDGVLRRITDRAVELVQADVCLVLLRNEQMGCWIVEAASGEWNDTFKKSVMLWEELPVSVQAFESRETVVGEHFRSDQRPQVVRRNLIGESMLAIPLLSQGLPFGVLSLLSQRPRPASEWNQRLAKGLAQDAAVAISNARLYEAVQQKQRGLQARLRHLEHLAEALAHDLKGPGARMEELAKLLGEQFAGQLDERTSRWLKLLQDNGSDLVQRVEGILAVARVGVGQGSVTAVDPTLVISEVLKGHAGEIERLRATVRIEPGLPLVACHGAYLRQVFDNLISNALKYARPGEPPSITMSYRIENQMVCFSVKDRGIGIPEEQRSRVFQPFVRLLQAEAAGSGIGLAIVQRIVELYGGRVWIEGNGHGGCTVKFTVPWLRDEGGTVIAGTSESDIPEVVDVSSKGLL
jgi:signal transduction histidine kinase/CHASE3 domain sensor protein